MTRMNFPSYIFVPLFCPSAILNIFYELNKKNSPTLVIMASVFSLTVPEYGVYRNQGFRSLVSFT